MVRVRRLVSPRHSGSGDKRADVWSVSEANIQLDSRSLVHIVDMT